MALAEHADAQGRLALSQGAIASLRGVSRFRVQQILGQLVQSCDLAVIRQGQGGRKANFYNIICGGNGAGNALRIDSPLAPAIVTTQKTDLPSLQSEKESKIAITVLSLLRAHLMSLSRPSRRTQPVSDDGADALRNRSVAKGMHN